MSKSSGFSGRDILHSILIGLLMTVVLVVVGILIAGNQGIPILKQTTTAEGTPVSVAVIPTAVPPTATPTEIPCTAQTWWDSISAGAATAIDKVRALRADTPVPQANSDRAEFNVWKSNLELGTTPPPCAEAAQQSLLRAAQDIDADYALYVSPSSEQQRAQQFLKLNDSLAAATDELEKLEVKVTDSWYQVVRDYVRADCPAERWFMDIWRARNYKEFPTLMSNANPQTATRSDLQTTLVEMRNFSNAFRTDRVAFPECVQTAADHWSKALEAGVNMVNSALNGDLNAVNNNLVTYQSESTAFFAEVKRIAPNAEV
jgi:hypothetical protein